MRTCKVNGCNRLVKARGWCSLHWQRWYRGYPLEGSGGKSGGKVSEARWAERKAIWLAQAPFVHGEKGMSPDPVCGGKLTPVVCNEVERGGRRKTGVVLLWVECDRCGLKGEPVDLLDK